MKAPVLLAFYSPSRLPESEQMARDLATVAEEWEGRFVAGLVDIDAAPAIAEAVQLPSVPFVFAVLDGRPAPLIQQVLSLDDLRAAITQVMQQLTAQGMTARHQPRLVDAPADDADDSDEPAVDPGTRRPRTHSRPTTSRLRSTEYQQLIAANPADAEAAAGLAMATLLKRTEGVDPAAAREAATPTPTTSTRRPWWPTSTCSVGRSTTPSTGWSTWSDVRREPTATRRASTCSGCSPPSATRTRGC